MELTTFSAKFFHFMVFLVFTFTFGKTDYREEIVGVHFANHPFSIYQAVSGAPLLVHTVPIPGSIYPNADSVVVHKVQHDKSDLPNASGDLNASKNDREADHTTTKGVFDRKTTSSVTNDVEAVTIHSRPPEHPKMSDTMKSDQYKIVDLEENVACIDPEGNMGICQQHFKCASFFEQFISTNNMNRAKCRMPNGQQGICCQQVVYPKEVAALLEPMRDPVYTQYSEIQEELEDDLESIASLIRSAIVSVNERENALLNDPDNIVEHGSASHGHLQFFMTSHKAISLSRCGYGLVSASNEIRKRKLMDDDEMGIGLKRISLSASSVRDECIPRRLCDPLYNYYRTIDGSCNNLNNSSIGMAFTPLSRILPPNYSDGLWEPRVSSLNDKLPLPNVRKLSSLISIDENHPHPHLSLWVMQHGQFLDHDLSHVPIYRFRNMSGIQCCTKDGKAALPENKRHPQCFPIEIPKEDAFYKAYRQRCMNFVRSMVGPRSDCSLGYGDQISQITSFLDNSNIYGSRAEEEEELRLGKNGLLKFRFSVSRTSNLNPKSTSMLERLNRYQMLPIAERPGDECSHANNDTYCYNAGDLRANEMVGLTATHVLWMREHNRIARALRKLNPSFDDDQLFHEARRIVNAIYQHITYNEWLPIIVGRQYMSSYGLLPLSEGYAKDYDPRIDPSVSNEFAAAAYRMGHSLIQGVMYVIDEVTNEEEDLLIHEYFNNPFDIEKVGMFDKLLKSFSSQPIQKFDSFVSNEVTNRLFQPRKRDYGMDLVSLNIQRGRDHGLPGYNEFRKICRVGHAKTFDDLLPQIPAAKVNRLRALYKSVNDIDLFVGGLCEDPHRGALLGPTFNCIVGDQFARSKKADRFAYDLGGQEHSFTPAQLKEIRKASYSRILCDNSDQLDRIQPLSFYLPDEGYNPIVDCDNVLIPKVDLKYWQYY